MENLEEIDLIEKTRKELEFYEELLEKCYNPPNFIRIRFQCDLSDKNVSWYQCPECYKLVSLDECLLYDYVYCNRCSWIEMDIIQKEDDIQYPTLWFAPKIIIGDD